MIVYDNGNYHDVLMLLKRPQSSVNSSETVQFLNFFGLTLTLIFPSSCSKGFLAPKIIIVLSERGNYWPDKYIQLGTKRIPKYLGIIIF